MYLFVIFFSFFVSIKAQRYSVDSIQAITPTQFSCLKSNGYSDFIPRIYTSIGQVDNVGIQNLINYQNEDVYYLYFSPCVVGSCSSPRDQMISIYNAVRNVTWINSYTNDTEHIQVGYSTFYIDVSKASWTSNITYNREFILQIVYQATSNSTPVDIGIYTNAQNWAAVFGDWEELSNLPLWWNAVGDASLTGFLSFGGWKMGSNIFRQYQRNVNICGNNFDVSYRPIMV